MPHKLFRMQQAEYSEHAPARPVMLAIAGDSAAGKTTITRGLVEALGADRCTAVCVDDYHRYDRAERRALPFTPLHPDCNYIQVMEQHLQLLARGQPILKPVYDHHTGQFTRPALVEPRQFVIIEGLLPLHTKLARVCFDATVYLDPPEEIRRAWKVSRDTAERGYTAEAVLAELERREAESVAFIQPQRAFADIVIRFAPIPGRVVPEGTPLSAELMLRPTIRHPDLDGVVPEDIADGIAAGHPPQARARRGRPPSRRAARTRGRGPGRQRGGGEGHLVQARRWPRAARVPGPDQGWPAHRAAGHHPAAAPVPPARRSPVSSGSDVIARA